LGEEEKEKFADDVSTLKAVKEVGVGKTLRTEELLVTEMLVKGAASLRARSSISAPPVAVDVSYVIVTVRALAIVLERKSVIVLESAKDAAVGVRTVPESLTRNRAALGAVVESVSL
jgi:hypothetical protein